MKSILLGTPCYGGKVEVEFVQNLVRLFGQSVQMDYGFDWLCNAGDSNINRARNNMVAQFMQTDFDTLAFIDSDIDIHPNDFWRLAKMDDHIRGAAVATKTQDGSESLSCWVNGKQVRREEMPSLPFDVDYLGTTVLFIDRIVFETTANDLPRYKDGTTGLYGVQWFENVVRREAYLSEDYGFCARAAEHGFRITCDPGVVVTHYGRGAWRY